MKTFLATAAAIALIAPAANAAVISYSDATPTTDTDWTDSLSLQQFDPSLGTLTGVTFELTSNLSGQIRLENLGQTPENVRAELDAEVSASLAGVSSSLVIVFPQFSQSFSLAAYDGATDFVGPSGATVNAVNGSDTDNVSFGAGDDLSPFIGTGTLTANAEALGFAGLRTDGTASIDFDPLTQADATVTVTYEYDVIPLPAAGWALVTALGGLAWVGRRRKTG